MANKQCPNCNHFTFSENVGAIPLGITLIIGSFILPFLIEGGAEYHGGHTNVGVSFMVLILSGIVVLLKGIFFPSKTITYNCSNCKYKEVHNKN